MENPTKMDDLGVPRFWKHPYITQLLSDIIMPHIKQQKLQT